MSDFIPEDIQLLILKHLPVQTLLRCRCVCKWWKQVIDSQSFIHDHLAIQTNSCLFFDYIDYKTFEYLIADPCRLPSFAVLTSPMPERLFLVGTLHGVVCLYGEYWRDYVLWNPSIEKWMKVGPIGRIVDWYDYDIDGNLVGACCGFWIDPLTNEFRIIKFRLFDDEELADACFVYSSLRGEWKEISLEDYNGYYTQEVAPAVVIDNVGYWTVYHHCFNDKGKSMVHVVVVSFDFRQEIFLEPIDSFSIDVWWKRPVLSSRDDVLSLVYTVPGNLFDVFWRIEGEWVHVHTFCLFPVLEKLMWRGEYVEEEEVKIRVLATINNGLLSFDSTDVVLCAPLMMRLKEADDVIIANGFVPSLVFPSSSAGTGPDVEAQKIASFKQQGSPDGHTMENSKKGSIVLDLFVKMCANQFMVRATGPDQLSPEFCTP